MSQKEYTNRSITKGVFKVDASYIMLFRIQKDNLTLHKQKDTPLSN